MNIVVVLSGGVGVRFKGEMPKQYAHLCGKAVIAYAVTAAKKSAGKDRVLVAARTEWQDNLSKTYGVDCILGGDTHNYSVKNALDHIGRCYPYCKKVVFLDAARPFVTAAFIDEHFEALDDYDAVLTTQKITDSLGCRDRAFVDREDFFLIQKPESFRFELLNRVFSAQSPTTAISQQLPPWARLKKMYGMSENMKITYPKDLAVAEFLMERRTREEK